MILEKLMRHYKACFLSKYIVINGFLSLSRYNSFFVVLIFSLLLHVLYLYENSWGDNFVSAYLQSDAYYYFYKSWFSAFIATNGGMLSKVIPFSPYISLVTLGFEIFGSYLWIPYAVSAICTSLSCGIIVLFSERLFGLKIAFLAGLLASLCGVFIFFSGLTVKSGFELFGISLSLYFGVVAIQKKSHIHFFAAIVTIIITSYDRDNLIIILVPLLICFLKSLSNGFFSKRVFLNYLFFLFVAVFSVKIIINYLYEFNGVGNLIGVNFYVGNSPGASGGYFPIHGFENTIIGLRLGVYEYLTEKHGKEPGFFQLHSFLLVECFSFYINHPVDYFLLKTKHFLLLLSQYSYGHPEQYAFWRKEYVATKIAFVDWGVIVALIAIFFYRKDKSILKDNAHIFLISAGILYALTVWIFLVTERYRLPLYVFFILYAAWGLHSLLAEKSIRSVAVFLVVLSFSCALNNVMHEGAGWSEDYLSARNLELKSKQKNSLIYMHMKNSANSNDVVSMVRMAEFMIRQNNCNDAKLLIKRALSVEDSKSIRRLLHICQSKP